MTIVFGSAEHLFTRKTRALQEQAEAARALGRAETRIDRADAAVDRAEHDHKGPRGSA